jgi:hypothetical protein
MKKIAVCFALIAATALAGEWTGVISDSKCGAKHKESSKAAVACVTSCIKAGGKPVLVADGKVVAIANPDAVKSEFYGVKVSVSGEMKGEAIEIASIKSAE